MIMDLDWVQFVLASQVLDFEVMIPLFDISLWVDTLIVDGMLMLVLVDIEIMVK